MAPSEEKLWRSAHRRFNTINKVWHNPVARVRAILELRNWLSDQTAVPNLAKLANLLKPEMDERDLTCVGVPIERAVSSQRVTDASILNADVELLHRPANRFGMTVVVDCMRSAFNLGGIFRTSECFAVSEIWLCGYTAEPSAPQVTRSALGTTHMVPFRRFENLNSAIMALRHQGMFVVALETVKNGLSPEDFCWKFPCGLILGNERFGLSAEILQMCDAVVTIPSYGRKNSLNVVTAFGVAAYHARVLWNRDLNTKQLTR